MAHRNAFMAGAVGEAGLREAAARSKEIVTRFLDEFKDSEYAWLNERVVDAVDSRAKHCRWLGFEGTQDPGSRKRAEAHWGDVKFPAASRSAFGYDFETPKRGLVLNGKPVHIVGWSTPAPGSSTELGAIGWNSPAMPPDHVVYWNSGASAWYRSGFGAPEALPLGHGLIPSTRPSGVNCAAQGSNGTLDTTNRPWYGTAVTP